MAPATKKSTVAGKAPAGKSPATDKEAGKKTISGGVEKRKKRSAPKSGRWERYIVKLLKQVHPDTVISKKAVSILNSFIDDIIDRLCRECAQLVDMNKRATVTSNDVKAATSLILPGELSKHAMGEGGKAVVKMGTHKAPKRLKV